MRDRKDMRGTKYTNCNGYKMRLMLLQISSFEQNYTKYKIIFYQKLFMLLQLLNKNKISCQKKLKNLKFLFV